MTTLTTLIAPIFKDCEGVILFLNSSFDIDSRSITDIVVLLLLMAVAAETGAGTRKTPSRFDQEAFLMTELRLLDNWFLF